MAARRGSRAPGLRDGCSAAAGIARGPPPGRRLLRAAPTRWARPGARGAGGRALRWAHLGPDSAGLRAGAPPGPVSGSRATRLPSRRPLRAARALAAARAPRGLGREGRERAREGGREAASAAGGGARPPPGAGGGAARPARLRRPTGPSRRPPESFLATGRSAGLSHGLQDCGLRTPGPPRVRQRFTGAGPEAAEQPWEGCWRPPPSASFSSPPSALIKTKRRDMRRALSSLCTSIIPPVKWEGNLQQSPCTGSSVGTLRATWGAAFSPEHCALVLQPLGHRAGALWCPHAMGTAPPGIIWPSLV